jgi:hypothetical protein
MVEVAFTSPAVTVSSPGLAIHMPKGDGGKDWGAELKGKERSATPVVPWHQALFSASQVTHKVMSRCPQKYYEENENKIHRMWQYL